ncbi:unnamed protein product [Arctia plantaginis]|uniref:Uncharacterized protein n=1 Tax=Arctia plantaginis TaxID=874455 RepID=A0A8S1AGQ6_ARCPL|nr:unnamed protein product [Arctia plantaginis]
MSQSIRSIYGIAQPVRRPNGVIHTFLPPLNDRKYSQGSNIRYFNERNPATVRTWLNVGTSSPLPIILNAFNHLPKTTSSYDTIVTKSVPEATTSNDDVKTSSRFKNDDENEDLVAEKVTSKTIDSGDHTESNVNDDRENTTEKSKIGDFIGVIIKKHFYFQVQPVKPEGESDDETNETVYFID